MFAWLCLRMRYPQNSNGLYMIIYDVPCDNDYLMGYLVYPIFRHTHIYIRIWFYTKPLWDVHFTQSLHIFSPNHGLWMRKEGGNRVKWRASNGTQALRSYPWPVGFAQTASQKVDEHASFLRSSAKWCGQGYLGPTANLGQNQDLHPGKSHAFPQPDSGLSTAQLLELQLWTLSHLSHTTSYLVQLDCYIIVFLYLVFSSHLEFPWKTNWSPWQPQHPSASKAPWRHKAHPHAASVGDHRGGATPNHPSH